MATTEAPPSQSPSAPQVRAVMNNRSPLPVPPTFDNKLEERKWRKFRLAQAFRIFGHLDYNEGATGHMTVRDPVNPQCFWVNPIGIHYSLVQPQDLLLVDQDGNIMDESGPNRLLNTAAYMIHSAIHRARPDVMCAAHAHSIYGKAFSALGVELDMLTQDACAFYNDHVLYDQFNGVVLEAEEGKRIVEALGNKKAAILRNHGLLVAMDSIEATVFFFMVMERACKVQLLADAAVARRGNSTVKITPEDAAYTFKANGSSYAGWFQGMAEFSLLEAREGVKFTPQANS